eukprot:gene8154-16763_t
MEEIKEIVKTIVRGCAQGGVIVSDVLAAFVARTIVEKNTDSFALDRKLSNEAMDDVIVQSIEKLLETDSPPMETIKMQVDFDTSFLEEDNDVQKVIRTRNKLLASHKMSIIDVIMDDANDFETLMMLYRKIFRFLLEFSPNPKEKGTDKGAEREVAAALESVFPRIGLKSFVQLTAEEKNIQLMELARIVLGIRLFNHDQGRGGEGIENIIQESDRITSAFEKTVRVEVEAVSELCNKYHFAIVHAIRHNRRTIKEDKEEAEARANDPKAELTPQSKSTVGSTNNNNHHIKHKLIAEYVIERWSNELANKRQYLGFVRSIEDDVTLCYQKIVQLRENLQTEMLNLKGIVGTKASVPKEQVYPKFDSIASMWLSLWEEFLIVKARSKTYTLLLKYKNSFHETLTDAVLQSIPEVRASLLPFAEEKSLSNSNAIISSNIMKKRTWADAVEHLMTDDEREYREDKQQQNYTDNNNTSASTGAQLLSVDSTPDFMLLPLEFQGFCPWTIASCRGLLVPGKPALGVVRFENSYFVFDSTHAIKEFIENPQIYLQTIKEIAMSNPEFIHLLRIQQQFPSASIAKLLERQDFDQRPGAKPLTRDAGTETPVHFVEKHIDVNYHWNEWELRRRAIKISNLKNCSTIAQQTDGSHFRRDNDTQVYLPREKDTQTRRSKGTNPPIKTTYIAGLRGKAEAKDDNTVVAVSRYVRPEGKQEKGQGRVVTLTLDL